MNDIRLDLTQLSLSGKNELSSATTLLRDFPVNLCDNHFSAAVDFLGTR